MGQKCIGNMITFEELWQALYEHGASGKKEEGTRRYWEGLTPEQQEWVFSTIMQRLQKKKFVQYDPIRAIKEALQQIPVTPREPVNYRGQAIPHGVRVFSAKYNGEWGMYTQEDIDEYKMERPKE